MKKQYTVYDSGIGSFFETMVLFEDGVCVNKLTYGHHEHQSMVETYENLGYNLGFLPEDVEEKKREYNYMKTREIVRKK